VGLRKAKEGEARMELLTEMYTATEVAEMLKISRDTVIRWFRGRPGVIDLGSPEDVRKRKRRYAILRIPRVELERFLKERGAYR
jgi:hypothetical protein